MDHPEEVVDRSHGQLPTSSTTSCYALLRDALRNSDQLIAMISNYSTSYNAVNVGIVLPMLQYSLSTAKKNDTDEPYSSPRQQFEYTSVQSIILSAVRLLQSNNDNNGEEEEEDSIVASSLLAGMIFGQLIGGYLGDVLGKRKAILLVMILQIGGSLGSACISTSQNNNSGLSTLEQLSIWRFFLGLGAGEIFHDLNFTYFTLTLSTLFTFISCSFKWCRWSVSACSCDGRRE
jgi:MFS family permease